MNIKSMHIYPIKGLGGIEVQEIKFFERGMQYDRRWMLVNLDGEFITQRSLAKMTLFHCSIDDKLIVSYEGSSIEIDLDQYSENKILTTVWENEVNAYEVNTNISEWFSIQLDMSCRIVKMVDGFDIYKELIKGPRETKVSFADGYPYSIVGTASLDKLSKRLEEPIPANRFRANIVVNTKIAHEEDFWDVILVGDTKLQVIKPSARCQVINIDQKSAEIKKQPLKELALYRKDGNTVNFGANTICLNEGVVSVGDTLHFLD